MPALKAALEARLELPARTDDDWSIDLPGDCQCDLCTTLGTFLRDATRIELLDSWKCGHTGFSAHNAVTVHADDYDGIERLARYLLRPPLSLERLSLEPRLARYRHKQAPQRSAEPFDPAELLARMLIRPGATIASCSLLRPLRPHMPGTTPTGRG